MIIVYDIDIKIVVLSNVSVYLEVIFQSSNVALALNLNRKIKRRKSNVS